MLLRAVVQRARGAGLRAARPVAVSNASRQFSLALTQKPQQPALGRFARLLSVEDVPVPSMGDSITEGTVVEFSVYQDGSGFGAEEVRVVGSKGGKGTPAVGYQNPQKGGWRQGYGKA